MRSVMLLLHVLLLRKNEFIVVSMFAFILCELMLAMSKLLRSYLCIPRISCTCLSSCARPVTIDQLFKLSHWFIFEYYAHDC